jgi:sterol desaturase/sphingolipid hydroxylase (fatty acid hydroxylase superfamily)
LDLLLIQLAAMSLSFCGHYYIDSQYHVAGSWLGRFSSFSRKQQLHFIHHRHGNCNFAVIDFFWDRLLGTYRRRPKFKSAAAFSTTQVSIADRSSSVL